MLDIFMTVLLSNRMSHCFLRLTSNIHLSVCCFLLLIVAEQHGASLISLELRLAPTRQGSRRSLPSRLCLLLPRPHHPGKHPRRQRKWRHVGQLCSKGISTTLDGIRPPLL